MMGVKKRDVYTMSSPRQGVDRVKGGMKKVELSFRAKRGIYLRVHLWISSQVGFVDSMSASFFRLRQLFNCFSRAIAYRMSENSSKNLVML